MALSLLATLEQRQRLMTYARVDTLRPGSDWLRPEATTDPRQRPLRARVALVLAAAAIGAAGVALFLASGQVRRDRTSLSFHFDKLDPARTGISFTHEKGSFAPFFDNVMPFMQAVSSGACATDVDNDGDIDLFFTTSGEGRKNALYLNDGLLHFTRADQPALDGNNGRTGFTSECVFGDVDNDGRKDLLLLAIAQAPRLFMNTASGFVESKGAGLPDYMNGFAAVFVDLDRDADLDIVLASYWSERYREEDMAGAPRVTNWRVPEGEGAGRMMPNNWGNATNGGHKHLLLNDGAGHFAAQELATWGLQETRFTFDIGSADIDLDGFTDLYFANDFGPDQLYMNEGGAHFRLVRGVAPTDIGHDSFKGMNAEIGDIDGDGYPEIFVTNVFHPVLPEGNLMWKNVGGHEFKNVAADLGVKNGGWGWGGKLVDLDLDGDKDLLQTNGYISQNPDKDYWYRLSRLVSGDRRLIVDSRKWPPFEDRSMSGHQVSRVFVWDGQRFYDRASDAGIVDSVDGRGVLIADLDKDGRPDAVVIGQGAPPMILHNVAPPARSPPSSGPPKGARAADASPGTGVPLNTEAASVASWIGLVVEGDGVRVNRDGIGTRLQVRAAVDGAHAQFFEVSAGNGMAAQSMPWVLAGLGAHGGLVDVVAHWPDGTTSTHAGLAPRAYHTIRVTR